LESPRSRTADLGLNRSQAEAIAAPLVMAQETQRSCQATTTAKTIPKMLPAMASQASSEALALIPINAL
jgi:hypothetical protein